MKTTQNFNGSLTFLLAIVNTILLFTFFLGYGNNGYFRFFYILPVVIPIQLGFITYFEKSDKKKLFKVLTIISTIIYILFILGFIYLTALGKAFQN